MKPRWRTLVVIPALPERLEFLNVLAKNLWFCWNQEAIELFRRLDIDLWEEVYHNPVLLLERIAQDRLEEAVNNDSFLMQMDALAEKFYSYMDTSCQYCFHLDKNLDPSFKVAYFSAEYGLTESLPIYSGGLGVLSGDTLKSSSNLSVPLVGVGLLYQKGFFGQYLNSEGWQQEYPIINDFDTMPLTEEKDTEGNPLSIAIEIGANLVRAKIWRIQVGRIPLYLLDTNLLENNPEDREITDHVYGGDRDKRIRQEILLGMGGMKMLTVLGIHPTVLHMNEGHSAFAQFERIGFYMKGKNLSFEAAKEMVKSNSVFTTHTPVPAGNDYFDPKLIEYYFKGFAKELNISLKEILELGRQNPQEEDEPFCMTILALKLSNYRNGVSALHKEVSRKMWAGLWGEIPRKDIPITSITNGVHIPSFISQEIAELYYRYLGPSWIEDPDNEKVWARVEKIPDIELWNTHQRRRDRLIAFTRKMLKKQLAQRGLLSSEVEEADDVLDHEALTIGFARRFATYKRGDLLFRDPERLSRILNHPTRPVQIIFAGKAHPNDMEGKNIIKNIIHFSQKDEFRRKVVFLENYDISVARHMVQGVDVWLNTPRKPLEACGTSGMKAIANGALHMSIPDGWWVEGFRADLGWAIGAGEEYDDPAYQDEVESEAIYNLLEKEVVPLFYERTRGGIPKRWIGMMKASMRTLCPVFNSHRMVEDYVRNFYIPAFEREKKNKGNIKECLEDFVRWKQRVRQEWGGVKILDFQTNSGTKVLINTGSEFHARAKLSLGNLQPDDVEVELYYGLLDLLGEIQESVQVIMKIEDHPNNSSEYTYSVAVPCDKSGKLGFDIRVQPKHECLLCPSDMGLVLWG